MYLTRGGCFPLDSMSISFPFSRFLEKHCLHCCRNGPLDTVDAGLHISEQAWNMSISIQFRITGWGLSVVQKAVTSFHTKLWQITYRTWHCTIWLESIDNFAKHKTVFIAYEKCQPFRIMSCSFSIWYLCEIFFWIINIPLYSWNILPPNEKYKIFFFSVVTIWMN
jgi:hypothetical protein